MRQLVRRYTYRGAHRKNRHRIGHLATGLVLISAAYL